MKDINSFYIESPTKEKTRLTILNNSLHLFTKKGINGVTLGDIAKSCEITTRNLYRYYRSKEFLVIDCTYLIFQRYQKYETLVSDECLTGLKQLKVLFHKLVNNNEWKKHNIDFTTYIMYFDIYISTMEKEHKAFIRYTKEYLPHIEKRDTNQIKSALIKGIEDCTIKIKMKDIDLYDSYIKQSIFSLLMRINIKEYENNTINKSLIYKHIEILLEHLGVYSDN